MTLLDKSLLVQEATTGEPRFKMFEMIREFALEELATCGEAAAARRRHAHYFVALAETADPEVLGPNQSA
jgi:predicted ATPase